jgi:hypothetical protein
MLSLLTDRVRAFYANITTICHQHYSQLSTTSVHVLYAAALAAGPATVYSGGAKYSTM